MKETVEIVRCKNCVFWAECWSPANCLDNVEYHYCDIIDRPTKGEFYCSEGLEIDNHEEGELK